MIWEPFVLALVLGLILSGGLYFAYLWPSVEPEEAAPDGPGPGPESVAPTAAPRQAAAIPPADAASPSP